ncbi:MAG: hypothetical protein R3310_13375 [Candidatus Competibacteraceae bacterium]|nr:hypothetical protein [Candidatus Competibacteraceae bacterium]
MDHDGSDTQVLAVVDEIRRYLRHHPEAADTVEGISHWWLGNPGAWQALETVQQALDLLIHEGVVQKTQTADGKAVYSGAKRNSH